MNMTRLKPRQGLLRVLPFAGLFAATVCAVLLLDMRSPAFKWYRILNMMAPIRYRQGGWHPDYPGLNRSRDGAPLPLFDGADLARAGRGEWPLTESMRQWFDKESCGFDLGDFSGYLLSELTIGEESSRWCMLVLSGRRFDGWADEPFVCVGKMHCHEALSTALDGMPGSQESRQPCS